MIEALKGEEIVQRAGGRFKLTALIQHRLREIMDGSRPLVERRGRGGGGGGIQEIQEGKITLQMDAPTKKSVSKDDDE